MHIQPYPILFSHRNRLFEFHSLGPKGLIRKIVLFQWLEGNVYNLAFGDAADEESFELHDDVVSDNGDMERVLHTVADCVLTFLKTNPSAIIQAKGLTPSRDRLYRMMISRFRQIIEQKVVVYNAVGIAQFLPANFVIEPEAIFIMKKPEVGIANERTSEYGSEVIYYKGKRMEIDLDALAPEKRKRAMESLNYGDTRAFLQAVTKLREEGKI